eukprot:6484647-Pyramimonas_sp.AAC.1
MIWPNGAKGDDVAVPKVAWRDSLRQHTSVEYRSWPRFYSACFRLVALGSAARDRREPNLAALRRQRRTVAGFKFAFWPDSEPLGAWGGRPLSDLVQLLSDGSLGLIQEVNAFLQGLRGHLQALLFRDKQECAKAWKAWAQAAARGTGGSVAYQLFRDCVGSSVVVSQPEDGAPPPSVA